MLDGWIDGSVESVGSVGLVAPVGSVESVVVGVSVEWRAEFPVGNFDYKIVLGTSLAITVTATRGSSPRR